MNLFRRSGLIILFKLLIISSISSYAQPYFDPAGVTGWYVPNTEGTHARSELYGTAFLSLPLDIGESRKLVLSPFYENRTLNPGEKQFDISLQSVCLPVTVLTFLSDSLWIINTTFLARVNGTELSMDRNKLQFGGVVLNTIRIKPHLKIKFGLYYNREFFSDFFIPLAGIEWKISNRFNLFGTLPNQMKLECRISELACAGIAFKSITNSYRSGDENGYFKIEDNHLGLYADFYLRAKLVFMVEVGHNILREVNNRSSSLYPGFKSDSFIFKTGLYYRIRLDEKQ